jgi:hypothetical protein
VVSTYGIDRRDGRALSVHGDRVPPVVPDLTARNANRSTNNALEPESQSGTDPQSGCAISTPVDPFWYLSTSIPRKVQRWRRAPAPTKAVRPGWRPGRHSAGDGWSTRVISSVVSILQLPPPVAIASLVLSIAGVAETINAGACTLGVDTWRAAASM